MTGIGWRHRRTALVGLVVLATVAACTRGAEGPTRAGSGAPVGGSAGVSGAAALTLTVWDEPARGGPDTGLDRLDREFTRGHPNVRINRLPAPPATGVAALTRALSGPRPPDVVRTGRGWADLGAAVSAGDLLPLDGYARAYGWTRRFPRVLLDLDRFSPKRSVFGAGDLYGLPRTGELVGIYYNKRKLAALGIPRPRTWADFERSLARISAAGQLPIQFGNSGEYPAVRLFAVIQDQLLGRKGSRDLVFGRNHASWPSPGSARAARVVADWVRRGFLPADANGVAPRAAWARYAAGQGVYLVAGSAPLADLQRALGSSLGFMLPPPARAGDPPVTTGGPGSSWSVTARSRHPEVAAAYLDFVTSAHAADVLTQAGALPAVRPAAARVPGDTAQSDLAAAWLRVTGPPPDHDGLVPWLDYCTPTFGGVATARLSRLVGGDESPEAVADALARDYSSFHASR